MIAPHTLTPHQSATLNAIRAYMATNGISPRLEDIADATGVKKVAALEHVTQLEAKGFICRRRYRSRSIVLIGRCPCCGSIVKGKKGTASHADTTQHQ